MAARPQVSLCVFGRVFRQEGLVRASAAVLGRLPAAHRCAIDFAFRTPVTKMPMSVEALVAEVCKCLKKIETA